MGHHASEKLSKMRLESDFMTHAIIAGVARVSLAIESKMEDFW